MYNETELEQDVVEALISGRKINAIKRLREHRNIGLKQAKETIERYIRDNPEVALRMKKTNSGNGLTLLIVIAVAGYLIYKYAL